MEELYLTPSRVLSDDMRQAFTSDRNYRNKPNELRGAWIMAVGDATARCFAQHQQRREYIRASATAIIQIPSVSTK